MDEVIQLYTNLAATALRTLRYELRCHAMSGIDDALAGLFWSEAPLTDTDPAILALNEELLSYNEDFSSNLTINDQQYVCEENVVKVFDSRSADMLLSDLADFSTNSL